MKAERLLFHNRVLGQMLSILLLIWASVLTHAADEPPQSFTYQGRLYDSTGTNPLTSTVDLKFQIYNPTGSCLLYEERQNSINLATTSGVFAVQIGSATGAGKRTASDPNLSMASIFSNQTAVQIRADDSGTTNTCAGGYTPSSTDSRLLRVTVIESGTPTVLSPDQIIQSVPYALVAQTLQGISPSGLIQVTGNVTQANMATLTGAGDASALHMHDSLYLKIGSTGNQNLGTGTTFTTGQIGIGTSSPAVDLEIEKTNPQMRFEAASGGGGTSAIQFYSGATERARISSPENSASLYFHTGGTLALTLDSSQNATFASGVNVGSTLALGKYTNAQQSTLVTGYLTGCAASCTGMTWVNTTTGTINYWTGSAVTSVATYSGSFTAGGVFYSTATAMALTAAGTAGQVLTSAGAGAPTWAAASDSTKLPLAGGTMSGAIDMGATNKIINMADPTAAQDAATKSYVDTSVGSFLKKDGSTALTGNWATGGFNITGIAALSATGNVTFDTTTFVLDATNNRISVGAASADASSILDLTSTTAGFLMPRMTTVQRDAITSPATGLAVYNTTTNAVNYYNGTAWTALGTSGGSVTSITAGTGLTGGTITTSGTIAVDVGTTASKIVQLDGSAKLPAVDGSALTNLNASNLASGTVPDARLSANVALLNAANAFTNANTVTVATATKIALVLKSSDDDNTKNAFEVQNAAGTVKASIRPDGVPTATTDLTTKTYVDSAISGSSVFVKRDGTTALTGNWAVGSFNITGIGSLGAASATITGDLTVDTNTLYVDSTNNRVGIGTNSPTEDLVIGTDLGTNYSGRRLVVTDTTGAPGFVFGESENDRVWGLWDTTNDLFYIGNKTSSTTYSNVFVIKTNRIGLNTTTPDASSILDLTSTTAGFLLPRMDTTQRNAIASPATGLAVYNTTTNAINYYNGTAWTALGTSGGTVTSITAGTGLTGGTITTSGTIAVDVGTGASQIVQLDGSAKLPAVDGSALTNLNASNLASGTVPDARLSANVALLNAANAFTNANTVTVATATKIALVLKSSDDDNTKNAFEVQNAAGTVKASIRPDGVPTASTDLVTKTYVDTADGAYVKKDGTTALTGNWAVGSFNITGISALGAASATITGDVTVDTNTLFVDSTNNRVGIGTTTPASTLQVVGGSILMDNNQPFQMKDSSGTARNIMTNSSGNNLQISSYVGSLQLNSAAAMQFLIASAEKARLDSSGQFGLNKTPATLLDITGTGTAAYSTSTTKGINLTWADSTTNSNFVGLKISSPYASGTALDGVLRMNRGTSSTFIGMELGTYSNHPLRFITNATTENGEERMRIDTSGRVGIGTASPAATAILDLTSTTLGFLLPRMNTTQRDAITSPATGLAVYNTTTNAINYYNGTAWTAVGTGGGSGTVTSIVAGTGLTGGTITTTGTIAVDVGTGNNQIVQLDGSAKLPAVDGSALTNLNASNLASGTVPDARLSANVALLNAANAFTNANTVTVATATKIALVLKSSDDDNTKNAFEVQNAAGTVKASIRPDGVPTASTDLVTKSYADTAVGNYVKKDGSTALTGNWAVGTFDITGIDDLSSATLAVSGASTLTGNLTVDTNTLFVDSSGNEVGIGTTSPRATLDVTGTIISKAAVSNAGGPIDFATGNLQYSSSACGTFALHNMIDGGSYTLAIQGSGTSTCVFNTFSDAGTTGLTEHYPSDHAATAASTHTIYTFLVVGSHVYISWVPDFTP